MSTNKVKKVKSREKFWTGSGRFFLTLILVYLSYIGTTKIVDAEKNQVRVYSRDDIELSGNKIISHKEILTLCGFQAKSKKNIPINIEDLAEKIMSLKFVKGVSITTRLPRILNITIEEREPVAFIYGRGLNLIDEQGFLIPIPNVNKVWDLPLISGIKQQLGKLGQQSTAPDTYTALEIVAYLELENPLLLALVSEINMQQKNHIELFMIKGGATIRINKNSFYKELYVLENYLASYLDWAQLNKIEYIDLRFKDQLIVKHKA
jgi:cell division septal protein FtsQ